MKNTKKTAIIIGAGPAGLTAAYELLTRTDIKPIVLEKSNYVGGISRTHLYNGNRIDIGGHRFFSKSDRVMNWWLQQLPIADKETASLDPEKIDNVMLLRSRKSRIYFNRNLFDYPVTLSIDTIIKLGPKQITKIALSYLWRRLIPIRNEQNLEQFFINRFGKTLYLTFFKSYTEKVWGVPCTQISAEWGAQRVKGLSISKAVFHAAKKMLCSGKKNDFRQRQTETSLIDQFMYPKLGPGQMWEIVADRIRLKDGDILNGWEVRRVITNGKHITGVEAANDSTGQKQYFEGAFFFSSMPVKDLIQSMEHGVPAAVLEVSNGLVYRDFITVGLLLNRLKLVEKSNGGEQTIRDSWIYIQEPDVLVGRLQIYNNWSPYMVADPSKIWIGLEYFCNYNDELWNLSNAEMINLAIEELVKIGIIDKGEVQDATVIRMEKTYPAYFGTYHRFNEVQSFLDEFENLFPIGRNGMHKYNNMDHSMLTAMNAVDNIVSERKDKSNLWNINTEQEYHEVK